MNIKEFIPEGEANAISMKELSLRIGATERETRRLVLSARRNDAPICSDCKQSGGYYLPDNGSEALRYVRQQEARIKTAQEALNGVKKYLEECKEK